MNYYYNNTYDTDDWFKVTMPQAGGRELTIQSPDNNDYYLRLYQPDTSTVISRTTRLKPFSAGACRRGPLITSGFTAIKTTLAHTV